jgi:intracellular sulfur oxidation DsrE/DsrF family protein
VGQLLVETLVKHFDQREQFVPKFTVKTIKLEERGGEIVRNEATALLKRMKTLHIAFMTVFCHKSLRRFDVTSDSLQEKSLVVFTAVNLLSSVKECVSILSSKTLQLNFLDYQTP